MWFCLHWCMFACVCVFVHGGGRLTSSQLQGVVQYPISPCCPRVYTWLQSCIKDKRRKRSWGGRGKNMRTIWPKYVHCAQLQFVFPSSVCWLFLHMKSNISFYLTRHNSIVPHNRSVIHSNWLDFGRGQQDTGGALLSKHGHTGEQVGCRAEQSEVDLHGHCLSVQPATWMQEPQFGGSVRPAEEQKWVMVKILQRVDMTENHFGRHQIQKNVCVSHFVWPKPTAAFGLE